MVQHKTAGAWTRKAAHLLQLLRLPLEPRDLPFHSVERRVQARGLPGVVLVGWFICETADMLDRASIPWSDPASPCEMRVGRR